MSWALFHIKALSEGKTVTFRPRGNSMTGRISSGQLCTVSPRLENTKLAINDIVLCKVKGNDYLHLIKAVNSKGQYLIGNNRGGINGWINQNSIYGKLISVEN